MKLGKTKLEQKTKNEKKIDGEKDQNINAKLPKLVITKFKGTPTDWLQFWDQFTAEIDSADDLQVTKFSLFKDGLLLTTEGYQRAKNILRGRYGKEKEIVTAYVTSIMSLPTIHGTNPNKILDCYEKLCSNVLSRETMGK